MENQRQKFVYGSFIAAAALLYYIVFELASLIAGIYDLEARVQNADLILRGSSILLGFILFVGLWRSDRANQFMNEVVVELSRVTWPTSKDSLRATVVVMIMVLISGLFLGGMDSLWTWMLQLVI